MTKLNLRRSCYEGIKDICTKQIMVTPEHQKLIQESNLKIEKIRLDRAKTYAKAKSYLAK